MVKHQLGFEYQPLYFLSVWYQFAMGGLLGMLGTGVTSLYCLCCGISESPHWTAAAEKALPVSVFPSSLGDCPAEGSSVPGEVFTSSLRTD